MTTSLVVKAHVPPCHSYTILTSQNARRVYKSTTNKLPLFRRGRDLYFNTICADVFHLDTATFGDARLGMELVVVGKPGLGFLDAFKNVG